MAVSFVSTNLPTFAANTSEGRNYQNKAKPTASNTFESGYVPIRFTTSGNAVAAADTPTLTFTDRTYKVLISFVLTGSSAVSFMRITYPGDSTTPAIGNSIVVVPGAAGIYNYTFDVAPGMTFRAVMGTGTTTSTINVTEYGMRPVAQGSMSA